MCIYTLKSYNISVTETKNKITFLHRFLLGRLFTTHVSNESTKDPLRSISEI